MWLYRFPELLRQLDNSKQRLGVASYGLAVTTLEEVFLKVSLQQGGLDSGSIQEVRGMSLPLLLHSVAALSGADKSNIKVDDLCGGNDSVASCDWQLSGPLPVRIAQANAAHCNA